MPIPYDCSTDGLIVIIAGITCNCSSEDHKQAICNTIRRMNEDEAICIDRRRINNPSIPPYDWSIVPLIDGISIVNTGAVAVNIFSEAQDLPLIYQIFQKQINSGVLWCTVPAVQP